MAKLPPKELAKIQQIEKEHKKNKKKYNTPLKKSLPPKRKFGAQDK